MRNIVVFDEYSEDDIRPSGMLGRYLELVEKEVRSWAADLARAERCPGCGSASTRAAFDRFGLSYRECSDCSSLFLAVRPSDEILRHFYTASEARRYWHHELAAHTRAARASRVIKPQAEWIADATAEYRPQSRRLEDIRGSDGSQLEEVRRTGRFESVASIDSFAPPDRRSAAERAAENGRADAVALFGALDRATDPGALMGLAAARLAAGGLCFVTAILSSGFDVRTLWERAGNIFPPDRLNVFSVEGLRALAERHGFEILELSTPGVLDVEIVERVLHADPEISTSSFVGYVIQQRASTIRASLQEFLQANMLSSFGRAVFRLV